MRTGAIFARGSCRALKWMALFGVVFALGAGSAAAQITVEVPEMVDEGETVSIVVGGTVPTNTSGTADTVTVSIAVVTDSSPTAPVTAGDAEDFGDFSDTFTVNRPADGASGATIAVSGTIDWTVGRDPNNAEDEAVTVNVTASSGGTVASGDDAHSVTIEDTETQGYELSGATSITEGATAATTLTLQAVPPKTVELTAIAFGMSPSDPSKYTLTAASAATLAAGGSVTTTIMALADGNRDDDTVTVTAYGGAPLMTLDDIEITAKDIHGLPDASDITVAAYDEMTGGNMVTSVAEGDTVYLEVMVDRGTDGYPMGEALEVALSLSDSSLATLGAAMVDVASGTGEKTAARVGLTAAAMDTFPQAEMLVVSLAASGKTAANGMGSAPGTPLTLTITDATVKQVSVKDGAMTALYAARDAAKGADGMLNPGDDFSIDNDMLFEAAEGFTFQVDARSSMSAVVSVDDSSGDSISVMPESVGGPAMVTLTATALPASSFRGTQVSESVATIEFEVMVEAVPTAAPDAPAAPTVATGKAQGALDVSWTAPNDNGSAIIDYSLQYKMSSSPDWTVMTAAVTGMSTTLSGLEASTAYDVQVRARNADGMSPWSKSGMGTTPAPPTPPKVPVVRGQLTEFELVGDGVSEKTIGGVERYHVPEGSQAVDLSVTVQWTHAEIAAIGYNTAQTIEVAIMSGGSTLPNWVSWIDGEGDVHFPRAGSLGNLTGGVVTVKTPRESQVPAAQRGSERHVKSVTGTLDVLILHDDHEAENDAFYIQATGGDVDLNAPRGVNAVTPEVVIEDDEDQTVTVKMGSKTSSTVYEGDSGDDVPTFTVAAKPARVDLPLEVRLDMVDLGGTTVSSGEISLSRSSMTLNDGSTGNSDTVTVHLPASDGNRVDNDYELHASVNVYSLASGGYETLPAASHPIKVLDRHKLPTLMVTPATGTVAEGGMVELTLTINRNPSNTPVSSTEKLQYTQEEVSIMLDMGAGSTASAADFSVMTNPVVFPKRERGSYTASKTVEVMATSDDVLDEMEMLVLDAMVAGSVAANGTEKDSHMAVSTLTIEDGTGKLVWANSQEEVEAAVYAAKNAGMGDDMTFTAGEMIEVMGGLLFSSAEGVTVSYSAMTSDAAVAATSVSGGMVTVTAAGAGMADITITAHASRPSGVKIADQTDPTEASIMFPVEVGLEALSITLSGPEEMNLVEGGMGAMVMATANRAVTEDVTVMLMRDRAMSTAGDADYTAEPITIEAGMMAGSTMVMAVEDDMMETVDNMPEELVLYGMAEGMAGEVTGELKFYLWDAAVPALPVIAQLLLAAFLAVGGYRRYRRR